MKMMIRMRLQSLLSSSFLLVLLLLSNQLPRVVSFARIDTRSSAIVITKLYAADKLPNDVSDAVKICRQAVQHALEKRMSRMDIEMPVGTKFGVEKGGGGKKGSRKDEMASDAGVTREMQDTSDRELSRLFVDMFQPVGGENISVVFTHAKLADTAKRRWKGDSSAQCKILSVDKKVVVDKKTKKKRGFAAKLAAELDEVETGPFKLPPKCEVALFVSPGPKEMIAIERVCNEVGQGTLVILLNARLSKIEKFPTETARTLFLEEFEPVYHLAAAPQDCAPDCLLFRSFPGDWLLARKPKVGAPKVIAKQSTKFSDEECGSAFDSLELSDLEKLSEGALANVASWFK